MMRRPTGVGGGRMLRAVGKAMGANAISAVRSSSAAKSSNFISAAASSTVSSPLPSSTSSVSFVTFSPTGESNSHNNKVGLSRSCLVDEWEDVAEDYRWEEEERLVFGPPPTREEAEEAVATIQQIFVPLSYSEISEDKFPSSPKSGTNEIWNSSDNFQRTSLAEVGSDWIEPSQQLLSSGGYHSPEHGRVLNAFHLLQTNPAIKRMVVSLSSDKAVWDAVMKNEVVQEIKRSFSEGGSTLSDDFDDDQHAASGVVSWIMENIKARITELVKKIGKLVNDLFGWEQEEEKLDPFEAAIRSSFMLSVMVFIIVVVARVQGS